ncbi:mannitol operon transcriptional antiterminator [Gracilibacillus halotolerans]|uniref:Mannitol operon transcriptional antiterminator n=1 Tax=Gracilibacillus halotolerans TaxID=74386 RepID=A0A841RL34_9BACI|nr:BglG family transcription antiterminator [Gracilibacillus halotolerans]MBB6512333.1 mannitol operon transcriptional antiterminator [Gracilibacillus halotolerans]
MYISGRERKLVELLLSLQSDITIRELAKELDVSERTVHRDLKNAEELLAQYHLSIQKKAGVGISIVGEMENKQQLKLAILQLKNTDYTPEERQAIILTTLLEAKEPLKLYALANELHVTIATVSNDLDVLQPLLEKYDLQLVRKRGYGVKMEGDEANKRSAISYLISKHVDESEVITLLRKNIEKQSQVQTDTISNRLLGLVDRTKLAIIEQTIDRMLQKLPYELADSAYVGLVVHLALALERLQKGETIQFDEDYLEELEDTSEYAISKEILNELEKIFQLRIPNDETGYITMHLLGAKLRYDHDHLLEESSVDMAFKAKELIEFVSEQLDKSFEEQDYILNDLVTHLKPAIYRLQQGMNIKNPLVDEIEKDYLPIFKVIEAGVKHVFPDLIFPREEIAFLVLHFASALLRVEENVQLKALVICSSGIGTSKMLATKINRHFTEIADVENHSLFDLDKITLSDYDLIVSTVPIKHIKQEYILASPILTKTDIHHINRKIRQVKLRLNHTKVMRRKKNVAVNENGRKRLTIMQQYSNEAVPILNGFYLRPVGEEQSIGAILQKICGQLEEQQVVSNSEKLVTKLLHRMEIGGLGIPDTTLALIHTRSEEVIKPSFTIHSLEKPMQVNGMDGKPVQMKNLLLMISPENVSEASLEILSCISGLLIKDEASKRLFQSDDEEAIATYLAEQLNAFISDKMDTK